MFGRVLHRPTFKERNDLTNLPIKLLHIIICLVPSNACKHCCKSNINLQIFILEIEILFDILKHKSGVWRTLTTSENNINWEYTDLEIHFRSVKCVVVTRLRKNFEELFIPS